ncbi:unnamed protein product [Rangifer tarandus platyrhynchus]|uniref:Uncharacterized protein n=1 Tax=Rangifer tarandus platyrhynchus TaxID=3082113 RepID=A0ABN9A1H6_RANTA|nr:unnamed protein product [Rangifer tarandus platyrhynchus]
MLAPHSTRKRSEADPTNFTLPSLTLGGQATWRVDAWLDLVSPHLPFIWKTGPQPSPLYGRTRPALGNLTQGLIPGPGRGHVATIIEPASHNCYEPILCNNRSPPK